MPFWEAENGRQCRGVCALPLLPLLLLLARAVRLRGCGPTAPPIQLHGLCAPRGPVTSATNTLCRCPGQQGRGPLLLLRCCPDYNEKGRAERAADGTGHVLCVHSLPSKRQKPPLT
ncbi:unnamed protein product [Lampetra planeri]